MVSCQARIFQASCSVLEVVKFVGSLRDVDVLCLGMQTIEEVFQGCGSEENSPKRLPTRGDAFGESLGTWLSLLYVYQCSKPCLFFISGRGLKGFKLWRKDIAGELPRHWQTVHMKPTGCVT